MHQRYASRKPETPPISHNLSLLPRLVVFVLIPLIIGLFIYNHIQDTKITIEQVTAVDAPVGGGGCGTRYVYDKTGHYQPVNTANGETSYIGPAPLYMLNITTLKDWGFVEPGSGCILPPAYISTPLLSQVLSQGEKLYPLELRVEVVEGRLEPTGSATLLATATLTDTFSGYGVNRITYAMPESLILARTSTFFLLSTTSLEYSPEDTSSSAFAIDWNNPAEQMWVVTPKTTTEGEQFVMVELTRLGYKGLTAKFYVEPPFGIPLQYRELASQIVGIATFLGVVFGLVDNVGKYINNRRRKVEENYLAELLRSEPRQRTDRQRTDYYDDDRNPYYTPSHSRRRRRE